MAVFGAGNAIFRDERAGVTAKLRNFAHTRARRGPAGPDGMFYATEAVCPVAPTHLYI